MMINCHCTLICFACLIGLVTYLEAGGGDDNYPQVEETDQDKLCTSGKGGQSTFAEILFEISDAERKGCKN